MNIEEKLAELKGKPCIFELTNKNVVKTMANVNYPANKIIPAMSKTLSKGKWVTIQLPKTEDSIFKSKWINKKRDERRPIVFVDGFLKVSANDELLKEYLLKCDWCKDNEERDTLKQVFFQLKDQAKVAQANTDFEVRKAAAITNISAMDDTKILFYSRVLNLNTSLSPTELKSQLINIAISNVESIEKVEKDEFNEYLNLALQAKEQRLIMNNGGRIQWVATKNDIYAAAKGEKAWEAFARHLMSNKADYKAIYNKVNVESVGAKAKEPDTLTTTEVVALALDKGVITNKMDKNDNEDWRYGGIKLGSSREAVIENLNKNGNRLKEVIKELK